MTLNGRSPFKTSLFMEHVELLAPILLGKQIVGRRLVSIASCHYRLVCAPMAKELALWFNQNKLDSTFMRLVFYAFAFKIPLRV